MGFLFISLQSLGQGAAGACEKIRLSVSCLSDVSLLTHSIVIHHHCQLFIKANNFKKMFRDLSIFFPLRQCFYY